MATEVVMPQMGESIFEGTITKWLKKVGDPVLKDEPLFEISTDKVDAEIPSPVAGILTEIRATEGETVAVNSVVALVGEAVELAGVATVEASPAEAVLTGGVDVVMPQMGESIFEGTITKWLKKVGDAVQKDEPLFEISTDKVDAEIPAPVAGVLTAIHAQQGDTVGINTVVAVIGGSVGAAAPVAEAAEATPVASVAPIAETLPEVEHPGGKIRSSPLVRRIAREHNLDLRFIAGSGMGGRITKDDALEFLAKYGAGASAPRPAAEIAAATAPSPGELVPMSRMRSIIAQRMVESAFTAPHVYSVYKVDMTRIVQLRERERKGFEQRTGAKLTYMPFIAAATVQALKNYPILNASLEGDAIRYHQHINLGIAVALEWGLIVPVIREAEGRDFLGLTRAIGDLAERARAKRLKPDEASGSTFTLTNSGVFGGEFGTPILNQPESAILAIGGLNKEAAVVTDADGNDVIGIRWMQHYCLGFDHRLIDGADAGKFMGEFKKNLENWMLGLE